MWLMYGKLVRKSIFHWVSMSCYQTCSIFHCAFSVCSAMMLLFCTGRSWWRICSQIFFAANKWYDFCKVKWNCLSYKPLALWAVIFAWHYPEWWSYDVGPVLMRAHSPNFSEAVLCWPHFSLKCIIAITQSFALPAMRVAEAQENTEFLPYIKWFLVSVQSRIAGKSDITAQVGMMVGKCLLNFPVRRLARKLSCYSFHSYLKDFLIFFNSCRISYNEAVEILKQASQTFTFKPEVGSCLVAFPLRLFLHTL